MGLLVLWIPISLSYTHDLATAWYAVSLVPRPVVVGLGVGKLFAAPVLILVAVMFFSWFLVIPINFAIDFLVDKIFDPTGEASFYVVRYARLGVALLLGILYLWLVAVFTGVTPRSLFLGLALFPVWLYFWWLLRQTTITDEDADKWARQGWDDPYVSAVSWGVVAGPPLPTVEISATGETRGALLSHAEGFWYVFNREGELVAIPDSKVNTVRISSGSSQ